MRKIVFGFIVITGLFACEKFEHSQQVSIPDCALCDHADALVGNYRGYATGSYAPNNGDSLTLTLERLFLGNSSFDDSTNMRFKAHFSFDSSPTQYLDTIQLQDEYGYCFANVDRMFTGQGEFGNFGPNYLARIDSVKIAHFYFEPQSGILEEKLKTTLYR